METIQTKQIIHLPNLKDFLVKNLRIVLPNLIAKSRRYFYGFSAPLRIVQEVFEQQCSNAIRVFMREAPDSLG
ncbi:MAG: hypothetical protein MHMPM18_003808 [Marteilia pararefringens]